MSCPTSKQANQVELWDALRGQLTMARHEQHSQPRILDVSARDLSLSFPAGQVLDQRLAARVHHITQSVQALVAYFEVIADVQEDTGLQEGLRCFEGAREAGELVEGLRGDGGGEEAELEDESLEEREIGFRFLCGDGCSQHPDEQK